MQILVDTSVWIDYFRKGDSSERLDCLIEDNLIAVNDLILAELIPCLEIRKQRAVIELLKEVNKIPLQIDWEEIIYFQVNCLKSGINGIGLPDLMVAQNAKQHGCRVYSLDKHFQLLHRAIHLKLF